MKERPILFSAPMVKALLAGTKTQTRRLLKDTGTAAPVEEPWDREGDQFFSCATDGTSAIVKAYALPGDRRWVRETWAPHDERAIRYKERDHVYYRADDLRRYDTDGRWRPSIFMPRWASRISLDVTGVRVERLQDISEADAIAEGIVQSTHETLDDERYVYAWPGATKVYRTARGAYLAGWDTINAKRAPAKSNPWTWVVEFQRA